MMQYSIDKRLVILGTTGLLLLIIALLLPKLVLGGVSHTNLAKAPPLTGVVAQAMGVNENGQLSEQGSDFVLQDTKYFDGSNWVFTTVHNLHGQDDGFVVLKKKAGVFAVVMGPGTAFDRAYTKSMPADLTEYLNNKGVLYDSGS